jgi:hypothetical protein
MTTIYMRRALAGALALSLLAPTLAFAAGTVDAALNASAGAQVTTGGAKVGVGASTTISAAVMTRAKGKADTEIDRRIKALTDLSARIDSMTKLKADIKQSISTFLQGQITALTDLKTKIDADTDGATLKTDIQSVTQSYRIFAVVMPQSRIAAAADREATLINMMAEMGSKLQARIQAAAQAGADVTALTKVLTDLGAKLGSAQTHAQTAIVSTATLVPDNGDKDKMKENTTALQNGRKEVQAGQQDLVAARKDIETLVKGLKGTASLGACSLG